MAIQPPGWTEMEWAAGLRANSQRIIAQRVLIAVQERRHAENRVSPDEVERLRVDAGMGAEEARRLKIEDAALMIADRAATRSTGLFGA